MNFDTTPCRRIQFAWSKTQMAHRLRCVRNFRRLLAERADELTAAVEKDVGRPPAEVLGSDVLPLAAACQFLEKKAKALLSPRKTNRAPLFLYGQKDVVHRRPHGIVGIIGTWNYPLLLNGVQLLQAMVAGNGVMWKPSEHGVANSILIHELILQAGFPKGLCQHLPAERAAGEQLLESDIDLLVFTGSAKVGRKIAQRCAERMIPSILELSGIDAMFVFDDADVEFAAKAAWFGITLNRGQTCLAVRRIFVHRSMSDQFISALKLHLDQAKPMRLVMKSQVEQAQRMLEDATAHGGQIINSKHAKINDPQSITPQIILNATPDMMICVEECFAPISAMMTFGSLDDALKLDERCGFALGASIFTADVIRAREFAAQLRTGSVSINDVIAPTAHPATPFGGTGQSGWGVTQGAEGVLAMTRPQVVSTRSGKFRPHFDGSTNELEALLRGILSMTHNSRFGMRWVAFFRTIVRAFSFNRK